MSIFPGGADLRLDLSRNDLPFRSGSLEAVVCMSAINYFTRTRAQEIVREVYRVLKPGGVTRFGVQDMEAIARRYVSNFAGTVTFRYNACETATAQLLCSATPATVRIAVNNIAPTAVNNSYSVAATKTLTVKALPGVLQNDTDPNGDRLNAILVTGPIRGTLKLNFDGSFTYTATNVKGPVTFTYQACEVLTNPKLCRNTATVTITVK